MFEEGGIPEGAGSLDYGAKYYHATAGSGRYRRICMCFFSRFRRFAPVSLIAGLVNTFPLKETAQGVTF